MTSYQIGRQAEANAAGYLVERGFRIVARNWRTRYCEIDIIAQADSKMVFVEVKYRRTNSAGSAIDTVTAPKVRQMTYAANLWLARSGWNGDSQLAVLTIGPNGTKLLYIDC